MKIADKFYKIGELKSLIYKKDGKLYQHEIDKSDLYTSECGKQFLILGSMRFKNGWLYN